MASSSSARPASPEWDNIDDLLADISDDDVGETEPLVDIPDAPEAPPSKKAKRSARCRQYCFTANVTDWDLTAYDRILAKQQDPGFRYFCVQREIASTGQLHWQGFVHFANLKVWDYAVSFLKDVFNVNCHVEVARGSPSDNKRYCSKSDTSVEDSFREFGKIPAQGTRTDLARLAADLSDGKSLQELALAYPTDFIKYHGGIKTFQAVMIAKPRDINIVPVVKWYFGPTGVGKSRTAFEEHPSAYIKMNNKWWDGYTGQKDVIFDDYRPSLCPFQEFLRILDRYPMAVEMKGTSTQLQATTLIITTCSRPEILWASRTDEALAQLFRRISDIVEFKSDGTKVVWKSTSVPYVPMDTAFFRAPPDHN